VEACGDARLAAVAAEAQRDVFVDADEAVGLGADAPGLLDLDEERRREPAPPGHHLVVDVEPVLPPPRRVDPPARAPPLDLSPRARARRASARCRRRARAAPAPARRSARPGASPGPGSARSRGPRRAG